MLSVQTNMLAWNAGRQLNINTKKKAKNTEKLSSGYRINRAADDAAGLSISEKMRRQIRGLKQGSDNITEGISFLQVADGALDEVVDMLQRINELSIKAYNGTNTKEDRKYIQAEVTQLVKEIERIADTTTFNEIPVFKGNPSHTVQLTADTYFMGSLEEEMTIEVPDWLKSGIDDKLEHHNYTGLTQEKTQKERMFQRIDTGTDPATGEHIYEYYYYGVDEGDLTLGSHTYKYVDEWTEDLDDNATAKISFEGLVTDSTDVSSLYQNIHDLLGSAVGVPCGTCSDTYYGIGFGGAVDGYSAYPIGHIPANNGSGTIEVSCMLDLSTWKGFTNAEGEAVNCFDKVKELAKTQAADTNLTDAEKEAQTKQLAEEIAQKLCAQAYDAMSNVTEYKDHFDRALTDGQYDIIVYDYRDQDKLTSSNAADAFVSTGSIAEVKIPQPMLEKGARVQELNPMWIVCSAQFGDVIPLELPLINAETLGIAGYDVSRYSESVTYSESYQAELEAWDNDFHMETVNVPERTTTIWTHTVQVAFNANGELKTSSVPHYSTVTQQAFSYSVRVHNSAKPVPGEGDVIKTETYDPDSNRTIKDALEYVMNCRTLLGAQQNRLEHAYNNNQNKHENLTASESRIRDTDIAKEMVDYSNNNILEQAGVSVLSQANQYSQLVLQLLQ